MNTFTITHTCGHEATHTDDGPPASRRQRQDLLRTLPCPDCRHERKHTADAARRAEWGLPNLQGTENDLEWAETIRAKVIGHNRDYHRDLLAEDPFPDNPAVHQTIIDTANTALQTLQNIEDAHWWIENRFESMDFIKYQVVAAIRPILNPEAT